MKRIGLLLLIIFAVGITSCHKEIKATEVRGRVTNSISGKPIENVEVEIRWYRRDKETYDLLGSGVQGKVYTSARGDYYYKFNADRRNTYYIVGHKPSECYGGFVDSYGDLHQKKNNVRDLASGSYANFVLHIINSSPFNDNDKICFYGGFHLYDSPICFDGMNVDYTNDKNSGLYVTAFGDTYQPMRWEVTKNSVTTVYNDSVFIKPCQVNNFTINY